MRWRHSDGRENRGFTRSCSHKSDRQCKILWSACVSENNMSLQLHFGLPRQLGGSALSGRFRADVVARGGVESSQNTYTTRPSTPSSTVHGFALPCLTCRFCVASSCWPRSGNIAPVHVPSRHHPQTIRCASFHSILPTPSPNALPYTRSTRTHVWHTTAKGGARV